MFYMHFSELWFPDRVAHPFKAYESGVFSIYTQICTVFTTITFKTFSSHKGETLCPFSPLVQLCPVSMDLLDSGQPVWMEPRIVGSFVSGLFFLAQCLQGRSMA